MEEVLVVSSSRDAAIHVLDLNGNPITQAFKNNLSESNAMCFVGNRHSGINSHDYIASCQNKKPLIHVYTWNKPQVHMTMHIQEVTLSLCTDLSQCYIFAGSKGGRIYCWRIGDGEIIRFWQAHIRGVTCMNISSDGSLLISASEDGATRCWQMSDIIDTTSTRQSSTLNPYRSWSSHTLGIRALNQVGFRTSLRVLSCSSDQSVCMHDVHANQQCFHSTLPSALNCMTTSIMEDKVYLGSISGDIFVVDLTLVAVAQTEAAIQGGE